MSWLYALLRLFPLGHQGQEVGAGSERSRPRHGKVLEEGSVELRGGREEACLVEVSILVGVAGQFLQRGSLCGQACLDQGVQSLGVDSHQEVGQGPGRQLPGDHDGAPLGATDVGQAGQDLGLGGKVLEGPESARSGAQGLPHVILRVLRGVLQAVMQARLMETLQVVLQGFSQDDIFITLDVRCQGVL